MGTAGYMHAGLTEQIIQAAFTIHNTLGSGFLEKLYENAMVVELSRIGLKAEQQKPLQVTYHGLSVGEYFADPVINDKIIVELKSVSHILPVHEVQLVNYLKATGLEIGLLINFAEKRVEVLRLSASKQMELHCV